MAAVLAGAEPSSTSSNSTSDSAKTSGVQLRSRAGGTRESSPARRGRRAKRAPCANTSCMRSSPALYSTTRPIAHHASSAPSSGRSTVR